MDTLAAAFQSVMDTVIELWRCGIIALFVIVALIPLFSWLVKKTMEDNWW